MDLGSIHNHDHVKYVAQQDDIVVVDVINEVCESSDIGT